MIQAASSEAATWSSVRWMRVAKSLSWTVECPAAMDVREDGHGAEGQADDARDAG